MEPTVRIELDQPVPDDAAGGHRLVFLGDDEHEAPLEVVAVVNDARDFRVIHAMKLRSKYQREYEEAIPWRTAGSS